jgi:hypothetical protein
VFLRRDLRQRADYFANPSLNLNQSDLDCSPSASPLVRGAGGEAMAPFACEQRWRKLLSLSAARLALATTAQYNKAAQRIAFGDRWPLRYASASGR